MLKGNKRQRLELSEPDLRILLDLCSKELIRQITHNAVDPDLVNLVKKAAGAKLEIVKEEEYKK